MYPIPIAVVGAGFMGAGIAQIAATHGHPVALIDQNEDALSRALDTIAWSLGKLHHKEQLAASPQSVLRRIETHTSLHAAGQAAVVFEAIPEAPELKRALFAELDRLCGPDTCFASNTSTIPIRMLAEATNRPDRVIGTHFFFPVPLNPLLELIPGPQTGAATLIKLRTLCEGLGKHIIHVKKDVPGFIMNRIFAAMVCEGARLVEQGVCGVDDVDRGLVVGYGMSQGPLAKADMAGLDVCLLAFTHIHEMGQTAAIEPPALLKRLVAEGHFGVKSGRGFYHYDERGKATGPAV